MATQNHVAPQVPKDMLLDETPSWPGETQTWVDDYLNKATRLGQRLGELHVRLATCDLPEFTPELFSMQHQRSMYQSMRRQGMELIDALEDAIPELTAEQQALAKEFVRQPGRFFELLRVLLSEPFGGRRIRVHGDFHLNQLLYTGKDFVIIDFEGIPTQSIGERRLKRSPLRDVAGLLRSFRYAAYSNLFGLSSGRGQVLGNVRGTDRAALIPWADFWTHAVSAAFLKSYVAYPGIDRLLPSSRAGLSQLLRLFVRERLLIETMFELQERREWLAIPLSELCRELGTGHLE